MPEGCTLFRTATVLREALVGRDVVAARGRRDGVPLHRVVGSRVERVESHGKHLLVAFSDGSTLHTHLRMHGSWHRYRPRERWLRPPSRAVAVIEVSQAVAVCFDAPTVELLETRAVALHPALRALGPDLVAPEPDLEAAFELLRAASRAEAPIGEALLDQRVVAGLGNVYRSEVCFVEGVNPFSPVRTLDNDTLRRLIRTAQRLLRANRNGPARTTTRDPLGGEPVSEGPRAPRGRLWVYGRTGRPCRRCGTPISSRVSGEPPRRSYWCATCQPSR